MVPSGSDGLSRPLGASKGLRVGTIVYRPELVIHLAQRYCLVGPSMVQPSKNVRCPKAWTIVRVRVYNGYDQS